MKNSKKVNPVDAKTIGATALFHGKKIVARSAKNKQTNPTPINKQTNPTPINKQTIKQVIGEDHFDPDHQWEKVEGHDNLYVAYAATLTDGGMGKFTGYVKYQNTWHDLRTFKEMKDEDGIFYLSHPNTIANNVTLKVII